MPTYEYECKSCGYIFDAFQNMSDEPLKICPKCGKGIHRLITGGSGIIFKGSGFYVNDNGGNGGKTGKDGKPGDSPKDTAVQTAAKTSGKESAACTACPHSETPACPKAANS